MMTETLIQGHSAGAVDTLGNAATAAGHGAGGGSDAIGELLHHVYDSPVLDLPPFGHINLPQFPPIEVGGVTIDLSMTKHVFFLLFAALVLVIVAVIGSRKITRDRIPGGVGNLLEALVLYVRDEIALPNLGQAGVRYIPYLLTTFFFILIMNLAGLVPYGSTATGNISVTGGLAVIAFFYIQASAIRAQGLKNYIVHLTGGTHWALWPIMVPIEIIGLFTKPFALMMRLFANMVGGHIVLLSLLGLIFLFRSYIIAPIPVVFSVGISMLEIFVAFLQAYIFTVLTALFMGLGMQAAPEGQEEHH